MFLTEGKPLLPDLWPVVVQQNGTTGEHQKNSSFPFLEIQSCLEGAESVAQPERCGRPPTEQYSADLRVPKAGSELLGARGRRLTLKSPRPPPPRQVLPVLCVRRAA